MCPHLRVYSSHEYYEVDPGISCVIDLNLSCSSITQLVYFGPDPLKCHRCYLVTEPEIQRTSYGHAYSMPKNKSVS